MNERISHFADTVGHMACDHADSEGIEFSDDLHAAIFGAIVNLEAHDADNPE